MTDEPLMNRRTFVFRKPAELALTAAGASLLGPLKAFAPETPPKPLNVTDILAGTTFKDQYGKAFNPKTELKDKPYLLVFGFGGCQICQNISHSLGAMQDALLKNGDEIPIVTVSIKPEQDKDNMKDYVARYHVVGTRLDAKETLPADADGRYKAGEKAYERFKDKPQRGRMLNILCAPDKSVPPDLEKKLGQPINPKEEDYHTPMLFLCNGKGEQVNFYFAAINPDNEEKRRKLVEDIKKDVAAMKESTKQAGRGG